MRFYRAYRSSPVCLPARCSFLTGRFPGADGPKANYCDQARYERDLVDVLNAAGYTTVLVGKDHTYRQGYRSGQCPAPPTPYDHWDGDPVKVAHPDPALRAVQDEFERWMEDLAHCISEEPTPFPMGLQQPARVVDCAIELLKSLRREGE